MTIKQDSHKKCKPKVPGPQGNITKTDLTQSIESVNGTIKIKIHIGQVANSGHR